MFGLGEKLQFSQLISVQLPTKQSFKVVKYNWFLFSKSLIVSLMSLIAEPLVLLVLFGLGVGQLLEQNKVSDYFNFILLGLVVYSLASYAYFSMLRILNDSKDLGSSMSFFSNSPMEYNDIIYGEFFWSILQSLIHVTPVFVLAMVLGLIKWLFVPFTLFVLAMTAMTMMSLAVITYTLFSSEQVKGLVIAVIILPMTLLSGVFFPIKLLPEAFKYVAMLSPVYHAQELIRAASLQSLSSQNFISLGVLFTCAVVGINLSVYLSKKRFLK